ncbi:hypothetical protein M8J76_010719 [Diaphorina citri]|nr:hypothetical protein M8J75_004820 [Diaphorina citri]KAI5737172.1 hypothetical protein M8J76_010719 [Diaphorina citri]
MGILHSKAPTAAKTVSLDNFPVAQWGRWGKIPVLSSSIIQLGILIAARSGEHLDGGTLVLLVRSIRSVGILHY